MSPVISSNQASGAFRRLEFDQFDAPAPAPVEPEPAPHESIGAGAPPDPADQPLEIAPGITLPTLEELERISSEAQREGYAAGYEEGAARGRMEAAELHQLIQGLDSALASFDEEVAEDIRNLAIEIARQVVRDTLATRPDTVLAVVREALRSLPQQGALLRVNPEDAQLMRRYLEEHFEGLAHRVVEDPDIARGGCLIESAGGQIDARVETRWRRVVESLSKSAAEYLDE